MTIVRAVVVTVVAVCEVTEDQVLSSGDQCHQHQKTDKGVDKAEMPNKRHSLEFW